LALILASASAIRSQMLSAAGVEHQVVPANVDEESVKHRLGNAEDIALELAKAKSLAVSSERRDDWVVGGDSVVGVDGRTFAKPRSREEAAEHLRFFSGRTMRLTSAVALARGGSIDWSLCDAAVLQVRGLTEHFIAEYLDREWPAVGQCVGVFRMEGPGVQLFESLDGSHFTILGMPLLPLLGALRGRGLLPE